MLSYQITAITGIAKLHLIKTAHISKTYLKKVYKCLKLHIQISF